MRDLTRLTKAELLGLARTHHIVGRSTMTKAELIEALAVVIDPSPAQRRRTLHERLSQFVDHGRLCEWRSEDGHPCGLPSHVGDTACGLHGDAGFDDAVPLTGHLGFDTWPMLWRQLALGTYDVDPFGLDPVVAEMAWHVLNGLYFDYFKVTVEGIENVPLDRAAVLIANHGGAALPYDGAMLSLAVANEASRPRRVRVMATEVFNMLPVVSHLFRKVGGVYASREDAHYLLDAGHLVGVFPEGEHGFMKPVSEAYEVQRLGRGGFVEVAERAKAPIVPVAIVGSEEVHPAVAVSQRLASLVKFFLPEQRVDQIALFPNPIPLPVRWHIRFLEPIEPTGSADGLLVLERAETVRVALQDALDDILSKRRSAYT